MPDAEAIALHEVTHLPRADWCEACVATRSREGNYDEVGPRREYPVIHLDYMFTKTEGEDKPMATHLVCVDSQTKYVQVVALNAKGGSSLKYATQEVVKMIVTLGYNRIGLRYDTEPSMKQLVLAVQAARLKMELATELEPVAPEPSAHGALRAERYIDMVRRLGNCLLATIQQRTGHKVESQSPLFAWAYVHAGFLLARFTVHKDGCTSHELVHGRPFSQKLCPFGSFVYAQVLPKNKIKGEAWKPFVWLGRTPLGQLHVLGDASGIHFARTIRRAPKEYDLELLKSMKGVPWDYTLEVIPTKRRKRSQVRLPVVLEGVLTDTGPGPDEAASDPTSSEKGMSGIDPSVPGDSMSVGPVPTTSEDSEEMIADQSIARTIEGEMPTGHEPEPTGLIADYSVWDDEEVDWSLQEILDETRRRLYEDGPPQLSPEELRLLDEEMDKVEQERLLAMGVLQTMEENSDKTGMVKLSCKFVHDWRFRGEWKRRSRLVAREFRFLQPDMEDLYSPASLSSLQKLFAALVCSNKKLVVFTGDVKDAYLCVEQRRPTYIETSQGTCYELRYNLPGQRSGARDWYEKFRGVLEDDGLCAFPGASALFIEPKRLGALTHVDDVEIVCEVSRGESLKQQCKNAGLNVAWEGPLSLESGSCKFLKKTMRSVEGGILIEQDKKHIQKLVESVGVEKTSGKNTPSPANLHHCKSDELLQDDRYGKYRTALGILLYIGPDRPDILYTVKVLSSRTTTPREHEWSLLCHLVRYLKTHDDRGLLYTTSWPGRTLEQRCLQVDEPLQPQETEENPFGGDHLLESVSDASWSSEPGRLSVSCSIVYLNGNPIYITNKMQKCVVLSSCEAEMHGSLLSLQEAILIKAVLEFLTGKNCKLIHRVDSSSCRALLNREGLGGLKHVDISYLWCQEKRKAGVYSVVPIGTRFCPPDLGAKAHASTRCLLLSYMIGVCDGEG